MLLVEIADNQIAMISRFLPWPTNCFDPVIKPVGICNY